MPSLLKNGAETFAVQVVQRLRPVARANGWSRRLPADDRQLWIGTTGALIAIKNDTWLPPNLQSLLMTLDHADLLGAVIGVVCDRGRTGRATRLS
jgi:hypothetical protein